MSLNVETEGEGKYYLKEIILPGGNNKSYNFATYVSVVTWVVSFTYHCLCPAVNSPLRV